MCTAVFLDVAQAFDKMWHTGLLYKLKAILPGPYNLPLKSYLTDRYFHIRYNGTYSDCHEVKAGVPQGSVIGPLLYLLFTADLHTTDYTIIATFTDDTGLLAVHRDPSIDSQHLQSHLILLHDWFLRWKIHVNSAKSAHITFTRRQATCPCISAHNPDSSERRQ